MTSSDKIAATEMQHKSIPRLSNGFCQTLQIVYLLKTSSTECSVLYFKVILCYSSFFSAKPFCAKPFAPRVWVSLLTICRKVWSIGIHSKGLELPILVMNPPFSKYWCSSRFAFGTFNISSRHYGRYQA